MLGKGPRRGMGGTQGNRRSVRYMLESVRVACFRKENPALDAFLSVPKLISQFQQLESLASAFLQSSCANLGNPTKNDPVHVGLHMVLNPLWKTPKTECNTPEGVLYIEFLQQRMNKGLSANQEQWIAKYCNIRLETKRDWHQLFPYSWLIVTSAPASMLRYTEGDRNSNRLNTMAWTQKPRYDMPMILHHTRAKLCMVDNHTNHTISARGAWELFSTKLNEELTLPCMLCILPIRPTKVG